MIRSQACSKAQLINEQLKQDNLKVTSVPGTPLETLVSQSVSPLLGLDSNEIKELDTAKITSWLSTLSSKGTFGVDEHQQLKQDTVNMVSSAVKRNLHMARNVALPLIDDIVEHVDKQLSKLIPSTGVAVSIQESTVVKMLSSGALSQVVSRYEVGGTTSANTVSVHKERSVVEIRELVKTGSTEFDNEVESYILNYLGDKQIQQVYNDVFLDGASCDLDAILSNGKILDKAAKAILSLLIGSALLKDLDDNINMSASAYENAMAKLMRWCGRQIILAKEQIKFRKSANVVVIEYPSSGKEAAFLNPEDAVILVDPNTYNKFLNDGGSPEMVIGSYLTNRQTRSDKIIENSDSYIKAYNKMVTRLKSETKSQEIVTMKRAVQVRVSNEIARAAKVTDLNNAGSEDNSDNIWKDLTLNGAEAAQKMLTEKIRKINYNSVTNIYQCVRDIVLDIFFNETDVRAILDIIDSFDESDDIQSVINLTVVYFVCDWVLEQMQVTGKDK